MAKKVLVVDDSQLIRAKVSDVLLPAGYLVHEASSMSAVVSADQSGEFPLSQVDLVLLDLYLRSESGLDLLTYITTNYPDLPVVMLSIEGDRSLTMRALEMGAKDYVLKPFDRALLVNKVAFQLSQAGNDEQLNTLKVMLSLEINRSLRSKWPFTLVKFEPREPLNPEKLNALKVMVNVGTRDIDQAYVISQSAVVMLLPLTDVTGAKVVIKRLKRKLESFIFDFDSKLETKLVQFPPGGRFENLHIDLIVDYEAKLLRELGVG